MKFASVSLCITFFFILITAGCSNEEPPAYPEKKVIIREPIKVPVKQESPAPEPPIQTVLPEPPADKKTGAEVLAPEDSDSKKILGSSGEEEKGIYVTKKGDTLEGLAARKDFYGDKLKWPVLYRHNRKNFKRYE